MILHELSANSIKEKIIKREISAQEVVEDLFEKIYLNEPSVKAYLCLDKEGALLKAREIDEKLSSGAKVGLLAGIPVAIKDNICTSGTKTTCASRMLENFVPPYDAFVVKRIKEEDAVIIGKTNLDEFAMGSSNENSAFHVTRNPWNIDCIPGGSGGGSGGSGGSGSSSISSGSPSKSGSAKCLLAEPV